MPNTERHAQFLFFADAIFVLVFSVCCLIYANHDVFLIALVIIGLLTVYPLYRFVDVYTSCPEEQTVLWSLEHFNMLLLYCLLRFFMLFGFFSWVLIDMSGINVLSVVTHFPVIIIVGLFTMILAFFIVAVLTLRIVPKQRAPVYAFIEKDCEDSDSEDKREIFTGKTGSTFFI